MRIRILDPHWKKWTRIQVVNISLRYNAFFKQKKNFQIIFFPYFVLKCYDPGSQNVVNSTDMDLKHCVKLSFMKNLVFSVIYLFVRIYAVFIGHLRKLQFALFVSIIEFFNRLHFLTVINRIFFRIKCNFWLSNPFRFYVTSFKPFKYDHLLYTIYRTVHKVLIV